MAGESLFRTEILAERQTQWLGTVLLTPQISHRLFVGFALFTTTSVLSLLFFGRFTHKERVSGLLVPEAGLVQVFAPQVGVVTEVYVQEGAAVKKGQPLFVLSGELESSVLGATQREVARRLGARRESLLAEKGQRERLWLQQKRSLASRLLQIESEEAQLASEIATQKRRVSLAVTSEKRQRTLLAMDLVADVQVQEAVENRLDQESKLGALVRFKIFTHREQLTLAGDLADLPLKSQAEIAALERSVAAIDQELAEVEARREVVVPAPASGTVSALQAERGVRAGASVPLLSIVPSGSQLEAQLFGPSRAIGFLRPGQKVLLRYQAYPYQKFGHYEGTVKRISRSAMNPSEMPTQLSGLTSLFASTEPVYRITVDLGEQTVTAYGQTVALQVGMQLEADVLIEERRLVEWILEPLFTLTGNWT
jgi:membrane fusion protein